MRETYSKIISPYLKQTKNRHKLYGAAALALMGTAANVASIFVFDLIVNNLSDPESEIPDTRIVGGYVAMLFGADLFNFAGSLTIGPALSRVSCQICIDWLDQLTRISIEDRTKLEAGKTEIVQLEKIHNETGRFVLNAFIKTIPDVIQLIGVSLVLTIKYQSFGYEIPVITWATLLVYNVVAVAGSHWVDKAITAWNRIMLDELYPEAADTIKFQQTIKMYGNEDEEHTKATTTQDKIEVARNEKTKRENLVELGLNAVLKTSQFFLIWVTATKVLDKSLQDFQLGEFVTVNIFYQLFIAPLKTLNKNFSEALQSASTYSDVTQVLNDYKHEAERKEELDVSKRGRKIVFSGSKDPQAAEAKNGVSFQYPLGTVKVIQHLNMKVRRGEIVGVVGRSGLGKTTFLRLLSGYFDNYEGSITIDGIELRDIKRSSLRRNIAFVPQFTDIFSTRSLQYNIAYGDLTQLDREGNGDEKGEDAKIRAVAQRCQLGSLLDRTTLEARVPDTVSGGEKQRIGIGRVVVRQNQTIYLFDEPTSALDSLTEADILAQLREISQGANVFMITHRLALVESADKILFFDDKEKKETERFKFGTHRELLTSNKSYQTLWEKQSEDYYRGFWRPEGKAERQAVPQPQSLLQQQKDSDRQRRGSESPPPPPPTSLPPDSPLSAAARRQQQEQGRQQQPTNIRDVVVEYS